MPLTWCEEADSVLEDLTKEGSGLDYVVFTVENPKLPSPLMTIADGSGDNKGQGGRAAVQACLEAAAPDSIKMGCFLISAIDQEEGSTKAISVRSKFVHVIWMGDAVGVMLRGKINTWYSDARKKFPQASVQLQLQGADLDDLQIPALEASLSSAGGAHKPKRYSFTNSTIMGRDAAALARAVEEAKRQAEEEARKKAEEERKAAEEARRNKAKQKAEEERLAKKLQAEEEEARLKAEEEARLKAEEQARLKAEEEARIQAEEDAKRKAEEEEVRRKAEEEARRIAEEEQRRLEEAERQRTKILITENATLGEGRKLILLVSKMSGNFQQNANTSRLKTILDGVGLPAEEIEEVDGGEEDHRERRNMLFEISGIRAQYPQMFLVEADGTTKFVGDFDTVQHLNDMGTVAQTLGVTVKKIKKTLTITEKAGVETVLDEQVVVETEMTLLPAIIVPATPEKSKPVMVEVVPPAPTAIEAAGVEEEEEEPPAQVETQTDAAPAVMAVILEQQQQQQQQQQEISQEKEEEPEPTMEPVSTSVEVEEEEEEQAENAPATAPEIVPEQNAPATAEVVPEQNDVADAEIVPEQNDVAEAETATPQEECSDLANPQSDTNGGDLLDFIFENVEGFVCQDQSGGDVGAE